MQIEPALQEVNGETLTQDQTNQLTLDFMYMHKAFGKDKDLYCNIENINLDVL